MSRIIQIKSVFILLCAVIVAACESDGDNMVTVSHEDEVEVLTEAELYKVDNDAIQHDSLKTELGNGLNNPDSFKRHTHNKSSDIANGTKSSSNDSSKNFKEVKKEHDNEFDN